MNKVEPKSFVQLLEEHFRKPRGGKVTATTEEKREAARKKRAAKKERAARKAAARRAKRAAAKAAAAALAKKMEEERANAPSSPLRTAPLAWETIGGGVVAPYPFTPDVVLAPFSKEHQTTIIRAARGMVEGTLTIPEVVVENAIGGEGRAAEKLRRDLLAAAGSYAKAEGWYGAGGGGK